MIDDSNERQANLFEGRVIPSNLAVTAMRDSGYKNTAYAIAELLDNAQQAGAKQIEVLCLQEREEVRQRIVSRLKHVAVVDNGCGMDAATLRKALQFGNGSRLQDRSGIGRFGMGLPNASISQASRVDVWSWKNGADNALHTYLCVDEMESGTMDLVPFPEHQPVPQKWRQLVRDLDSSGTLVVWSKLDLNRLTWKKGKSTLENTGRLVGRIYRKFLADDRLSIRLYCAEDDGKVLYDEFASVDDPLYLSSLPTLPAPFNAEPMFEEEATEWEQIEYGETVHKVRIQYSLAKKKTIELAGGKNRGDTAYGRHAAKNIGVSLLRAGRELMLDTGWCIGYDTRERWWGCEVEFPPALDEVFGVTNNKQHAVHFAELASIEWQQLAEEGETLMDVVDRLQEEGDPRGYLLKLANKIRKDLTQLRNEIKDQGSNSRSSRKSRYGETADSATNTVNQRWKNREEERPTGEADQKATDEDYGELMEDLERDNSLSAEDAAALVELIKNKDLKVIFVESRFPDPYGLFDVRQKAGVTEVIFNQRHPAFDSIFGTLNTADEDLSSLTNHDLIDRLTQAVNAIKIVFAAWARLEKEASLERVRGLEKARYDWGRLASQFLEDEASDTSF